MSQVFLESLKQLSIRVPPKENVKEMHVKHYDLLDTNTSVRKVEQI